MSLRSGALAALVTLCILSGACKAPELSSRAILQIAPSGSVAVLTHHNDNARTGQNVGETILTTANVKSTTFGQLGVLSVDGLVDAEPLYVSSVTIGSTAHNVVFVATEHDSVYAFDADTFSQLWKTSLLGAKETTSDPVHGCGQVAPEIGITATPVIDPKAGANGTIFVVAMTKDMSGKYHQRLHALDLAGGTELAGSPTEIVASYPGSGDNSSNGVVTFDPMQYEERVGLLLLNGAIYTGWTSHCDDRPYTGWIMGYSETTLKQTSVINLTPNGSEGAIWMSGAGLAADSSNLYFLVGNGTFDATLNANGQPLSGDYGNAFVKLSTTGGQLAVADFFTMFDTGTESGEDEDLGSGGALLLPDLKDNSGTTWQLAVGAGKDGNIYVVNRSGMGGLQLKQDNQIYQELDGQLTQFKNGGGVWSMPAYFNNAVYYGAVGDSVKAFTISGATLSASPTSHSGNAFGYPGTTPSVSANGATNGIVWAIENGSSAGVLHAYDASNVATELYNSNMAGARDQFSTTSNCKFVTPMIANGKVFVGTATGVVVFGLLSK